jgi:glucose-6-phosphate 1-dehydrogenase
VTDDDATLFVLFGATGDLAKRMVIPAFYQLAQHDLLPKNWRLVGNGRGDVSHEDFTGHVREVLEEFGPKPEGEVWEAFSARLRFAGGGFDGSDPGSLLDVIAEAHDECGTTARYIHYLAIPPSAFTKVTEGLGQHGLAEGSRVVYEKPFGTSPDGFRELDAAVHKVLKEEQVYRIDHFLGKEAAQDLHALRFGNGLFESVWNREHIRAVQIDVPETLDVSDRAVFYDETGALLDMIVTHLFQLAAEIAMEPPVSMKAEDLQTARESVISAFRPLSKNDVVLGQYDGYSDLEGVADGSTTDTFAAVRLFIDTDRWRDVPFVLRTGKCLAKSEQQVSLIFREPDGPLRGSAPKLGNVLSLKLSGSGSLDLRMVVKQPGADLNLEVADAEVKLASLPHADPLPPYVRLIHDVVGDDRSLFTRPDGLEAAWSTISGVLADRPEVQPYEPGSWGPADAARLTGDDGWIFSNDA